MSKFRKNQMNLLLKIPSVFISLALLVGCVSVKIVPYETQERLPKPTEFPIEILELKDITKPYKVIGIVQINAGGRHSVTDVLEKLRVAARRLGADALTDLNNQPIGAGVPVSGGGTIYSGHARDLWTAKAIVWESPKE